MEFIGVSGRDELSAMESFITNFGVEGFEHIADVDGDVWSRFGVTGQPAFVFVNDDGTITTHFGALGPEGLASQIEALQAA